MTKLRKDAFALLEEVPEDKLVFLVQIMKGVTGLYGTDEKQREQAFFILEKMRKNVPDDLDYEAELAAYREEKYGNACVD
ncbi:MAG: UDP-N-acetylenolpyruvoylglucosamine reductase [Eubacteriales bacterium]|nr:UDP-N-acetylenolpyruvoylglucosamine reductase [Eubacteriales bacterium]